MSFYDFKLNVLRNIVRAENDITTKRALQEFTDDFDIQEPDDIIACTFLLYDRFVTNTARAEEMIPLIQKLRLKRK